MESLALVFLSRSLRQQTATKSVCRERERARKHGSICNRRSRRDEDMHKLAVACMSATACESERERGMGGRSGAAVVREEQERARTASGLQNSLVSSRFLRIKWKQPSGLVVSGGSESSNQCARERSPLFQVPCCTCAHSLTEHSLSMSRICCCCCC